MRLARHLLIDWHWFDTSSVGQKQGHQQAALWVWVEEVFVKNKNLLKRLTSVFWGAKGSRFGGRVFGFHQGFSIWTNGPFHPWDTCSIFFQIHVFWERKWLQGGGRNTAPLVRDRANCLLGLCFSPVVWFLWRSWMPCIQQLVGMWCHVFFTVASRLFADAWPVLYMVSNHFSFMSCDNALEAWSPKRHGLIYQYTHKEIKK